MLKIFPLSSLVWIAGLTAMVIGAQTTGLPHILFSYEYTASGYRTACTYFGPYPQTIRATNGECPLVVLLREADHE